MDHATGAVVMSFGAQATANGAAPRWNTATLTCATTWCHGATLAAGGTLTEPSWVGGADEAACGTCHGAPPPAPHTANTACGGCHDGYTATTVNLAVHVDGNVDVNGSTCKDCHGNAQNAAPPNGVHGETLTTDRAVGAHQAHLAAGALANAFACGECHVVPISMNHVDGAARLAFGPIARTGGAPASFDASSLTCSTYCHGATIAAGGTNTAPRWTQVDGSQVACGTCHAVPPPAPHSSNPSCGGCHDGYSSTSVNRAVHVDGRVEVGSLTCSSCHGSPVNAAPPTGVDGDTATTTIAVGAHQQHLQGGFLSAPIACSECHAVPTSVGHADAEVQVAFGPIATAGGTTAAWDRATATCSATWCHGAFAGGNLLNAPSWTTVNGTQATCGSCHGAPPPAPHVQTAECGGCHAGYAPAVVNLATHVNGRVDLTSGACTACHGSAANAAPPRGTKGETAESTRAVGAHQKHLAGGALRGPMACTECHEVAGAMDHVNGTVELAFGTLAATDGAVPTFDAATLSCSNYCHGVNLRGGGTNLAPVWTGGSSQATCGSCHGRPPPPPHPRTQICDNCHPGYTLTSVNPLTHVNGQVEAENLTCSSCHGDNSRVLVQLADPLAIAAPPYGSLGQTDATSRSVGSHPAHVSRGDGIALPNKCRYCHAVPTTFDHSDGVSQVTFDSLATVGGATPVFDRTTETCSNTYCHGSTLGRGGTNHTPSWTNPTPVTCTTCHGAPPPPPHPQDADCIRCHPGYTATTVRKTTHVNGISDFPSGCNSCHDDPPNTGDHYEHAQRRVTCDRCHAGYTSTSANPTLHRNARTDVTLAGWNATSRTCASNSCHGSRYWSRSGAGAVQSCNQCHGVPPSSGEHFEHSEYACSRCHGAGYSTTTTNAATHMNGVADVPYSMYDRTTHSCGHGTGSCHGSERWGNPFPVTANCSNCHGFPPPLPHPQQTACQTCHPSMSSSGIMTADHNDGTLDLSGFGCTSCHGAPPASTRTGGVHPADANCYGCHSTTVSSANEVVPNGTHNDGYVQVGGGGVGTYGCQSCHGDQARAAPVGTDPNAKAAPPLGTRGRDPDDDPRRRRAPRARERRRPRGPGRLRRLPRRPDGDGPRERHRPHDVRAARERGRRGRGLELRARLLLELLPRRDARRRHEHRPDLDERRGRRGRLRDVPRRAAARSPPGEHRLRCLPRGVHADDREPRHPRGRDRRVVEAPRRLRGRRAARHRSEPQGLRLVRGLSRLGSLRRDGGRLLHGVPRGRGLRRVGHGLHLLPRRPRERGDLAAPRGGRRDRAHERPGRRARRPRRRGPLEPDRLRRVPPGAHRQRPGRRGARRRRRRRRRGGRLRRPRTDRRDHAGVRPAA